jgi:hypothetical protein
LKYLEQNNEEKNEQEIPVMVFDEPARSGFYVALCLRCPRH